MFGTTPCPDVSLILHYGCLPGYSPSISFSNLLPIQLISIHFILYGNWGFGVLGFWGCGGLGFWGFGVVGFWGFGVLGLIGEKGE
jgi:hypothetical protein